MSGWAAGIMLEGLYRAAGDTSAGAGEPAAVAAAAEYAWRVLTSSKTNSWRGMIALNATMTMESWTGVDGGQGGGTFSHPWTASPAYIVPRWLMGVRPLTDGWRAVAVSPLPPASLRSASVTAPTLRGAVAASFENTPGRFTLSLAVPGNTEAEVCLPAYLFSKPAACRALLGEQPAPATLRGGLLCLDAALASGEHTVELR